jgi:hypothetical protein
MWHVTHHYVKFIKNQISHLLINRFGGVMINLLASRAVDRGFEWDDDEVRFVLDQHAELGFHSVSPMKQQSAYRHVAPLGRFRATQSLLFLLNAACLAEKQQIPILKSLVWLDLGSKPRSTAREASRLIITPPKWGDMSIRGLLFHWANTMKTQFSVLV